MPDRSAGSSCRLAVLHLACAAGIGLAAEGAFVKPTDGAWIPSGVVEVIARAADGQLLLDGHPLAAERPFPGVLHARAEVGPGQHVLRLASSEGHAQVVIRTGPAPGADTGAAYVDHPPVRTECAHCHSVSRRGRFRFSGGCQSCHLEQDFIQTHSHQPHELASCGMCHDAHGSSVSKLLALPAETACKQCHN